MCMWINAVALILFQRGGMDFGPNLAPLNIKRGRAACEGGDRDGVLRLTIMREIVPPGRAPLGN